MAGHSNKNIVVATEALENTPDKNSVATIMQFVEINSKKIDFCHKKEVVLVMGDTGAGKTTLVSIITKAELNSNETVEDSGEYIIVDEKQLISGINTTVSKTIIPNLMVHKKTGTIYYDCPGFNDSRGVANDISVSYFTRKLLNKSSAVKFVFVISYLAVQNGAGDRHNFLDLVKHAVTFIKNIDKYADGIALIVTKVENRTIEKDGKIKLVDDSRIIDAIAVFLSSAKIDLSVENGRNITSEKREMNNKKIKFIDILLKKNNGEFERIGILRLANKTGPVAKIKVIQDERRIIKTIINEHLSYVKKEDSDFGYTVSNESKNHIHNLMEDMQLRLTRDVERIGDEIKQFYLKKEESIVDIKVLMEMMSNACKKISQINNGQLKQFLQELFKVLTVLNINSSEECEYNYSCDMKFVDFLQTVSNANLSNSFDITNGLNDVKKYLDESYKWYNFLMALHKHLSAYNVQKRVEEYHLHSQQIIKQCDIVRCAHRNINDIHLKQLTNDVGCDVYQTVHDLQLNSFKLKILKLVLNQALNKTLETEHTTDTIIVKGYNVKISDIVARNTDKFIEVFALNNLFIDADIIKIGQNAQVSFIAPTWYIIGDRKINLNGKDGEPHSQSPLGRSKDGLPGKPGGAAGNFLAIGKKSYDDQNLQIYLDGGKGGPGQDGEKGADGIKGETPPTPSFFMFNPWTNKYSNERTNHFDFWFFGKHRYNVAGNNGTEPKDGGNGGHGGIGGNAGKDLVLCFDMKPHFSISKNKGDDGIAGKGGFGGNAGENGDVIEADYIHILHIFQFSSSILSNRSNGKAKSAKNGSSGSNIEKIQSPVEPNSFRNQMIVKNYVDYMVSKMENNIQESVLNEFKKELGKNLVASAFSTVQHFRSIVSGAHRMSQNLHLF